MIGEGSIGEWALGEDEGAGEIALGAVGVTTGQPVLGAPALGGAGVNALSADGIATGQPTLGAPAVGQSHALAAAGIATGQPAIGAPALGGSSIHALAATGFSTGLPTLGAPVLDGLPLVLGSLVGTVRIPPTRRPSNRQSGFRS